MGDLWENDVAGSTNAGLIPVWLNAKEAAPSVSISHIRVKNWTELGEVLQIGSDLDVGVSARETDGSPPYQSKTYGRRYGPVRVRCYLLNAW